MVIYYRKEKDHDIWHWCKNCTEWPTSNYDEAIYPGFERPKTGELCDQCISIEETKECL